MIDLSGLPDKGEGVDLAGLPDSNAGALKNAYRQAPDPSESYAKSRSLAEATGLPESVVQRNPQVAAQKAAEPDWVSLETEAPKLTQALARDTELFKIAKDDVQHLSGLERTLKAFAGGAAQATLGIAESIHRTPETVARVSEYLGESIERLGVPRELDPFRAIQMTGEYFAFGQIPATTIRTGGMSDIAGKIGEAESLLAEHPETFGETFARLSEKGKVADEALKETISGDPSKLGQVLTDPEAWAGFIGQAAPSLYTAFKSGGSVPFLAWMEGMEASSNAAEFEQRTGQRLSPEQFSQALAQTAVINATLEKFGLDQILGKGNNTLTGLIKGALGEGGTEGLQQFNSNVAAYVAYNPEQDLGAGVVGSVMGGAGTGAAAGAVHGAVTQDAPRTGDAVKELAARISQITTASDKAQQSKAALDKAVDLVSQTKLKAHDPAALASVMEEMLGEDAESIHLSAETAQTFFQSNPEALAVMQEKLPEVAASFSEAMTTGGDVVIPTKDYITYFAEYHQSLADKIRVGGGMSLEEAEQWKQQAGEEFKKEADSILQARAEDDAFQSSADEVHQAIKEQIEATGRFTSDVADKYAALHRAFAVTMADRLGISPSEVYSRYGLRVRVPASADKAASLLPDESAAGGTFDQNAIPSDDEISRLRTKIAELEKELRTSPVTGLRNQRAFDEDEALGWPEVAATDMDGLKRLNTAVGHAGADQVLARLGALLLKAEEDGGDGVRVYHRSGDEFALRFRDQGVGDAFMRDLQDRLDSVDVKINVETESGVVQYVYQGIGISYGVSDNYEKADHKAEQNKVERLLSGKREDARGDESRPPRRLRYAAEGQGPVGGDSQQGQLRLFQRHGQPQHAQPDYAREARGFISFPENVQSAPSVITLLENADLSTFLHETGHFFFEVMADMASDPSAPEQIKKDMQTLLDWYGVKDLEEWKHVPMSKRRAGHEKFAGGFETYLFEGKAPNLELQNLFQRFRAWLLKVYESLRGMIVELTPEVRQVMDRMLATDEQIRISEAAQNYRPLFESAEEAGMTGAEWAEYLAGDPKARQEATEELERRSLKDMRWLSNAKSKALRELQKDAKDKRKAVRQEVRDDLLQDDIYQVRHFLIHGEIPGMELPEDMEPVKISRDVLREMYGERKIDSDPDTVTPSVDDIMAAVAKLGGISQEEAEAQGIDPANWKGAYANSQINQPVFGKRVFRKEGMSFDAMAEALSQYGYLPEPYSANNLLDKLDASLGGTPQYSTQFDYSSVQGMDKEAVPWQRLSHSGMTSEDGVDPDIIARWFGFTSGDHLVRELIKVPPINEAVELLTDKRMLERYGDISDKKAIERAAEAAIHNEARAKFVSTELRALARRTGGKAVLAKAAKEYAEQKTAGKKVKDAIKPGQYSLAEARAAKAAETALRKGDAEQAAVHKRAQLLNLYMFRAATNAREEVEKTINYLRKFDREGTRKKLDPEYTDQIDRLLEAFDLRTGVTNKELAKRASLKDWIEAQQAMGLDPVIDDRLLGDLGKRHFREVTLEELRGLKDAVKNIEHLGRLKKKLLTIQAKRELEELATQAETTIRASKTAKEMDIETRLPQDKAAQLVSSFFASHRKLSSFMRQMDGFKDGGTMWELFTRPLNEASDKEASMREEATKKLAELFGRYNAKDMRAMYRKTYIPAIDRSLSKQARLAIALNWGNEDNRQRIMDGYKWTEIQVQSILNTLEERDWKFVQDTWDYLNEYWSAIAEKEKRVTGIAPEKVEAAPVHTKFGTFRGGYYPIKYDDRQSPRAYADAAKEAAKQALQGAFTRSTTRRGHTKSRVEGVKRPVRLDFGVAFEHVEQVIHDLSFHEYLIDTNRLLGHDRIQSAIVETYGHEVYQQIKKTIDDVAAGDVPAQTAFQSGINWIRAGSSIAAMGWNLGTALLQPFGLTQSMVRIGPKWVAKGMSRWLRDAASMENSARWISERSEFMRLRAKTMQREINEIRNKVEDQSARKKILGPAEDSYFWLIAKAQMIADIPTWLGQYEKAMAQGETEEKAIAMADQAVLDSQGGGQVKDLAQIQRGGPLMKLWTNFYSYFNVTYNLTAESIRRTKLKDPASVGRLAADMFLLYSAPAVLGWLLRSALIKGECEGGTDIECVGEQLAREQVSYLLGTMVGLRELSGAAQGFYGYEGPGGARGIAAAAKLVKQVEQGEVDQALIKSLNATAGVFLHYPAGQVQRTVEGIAALSEGETANPLAVLMGAPK